MGSLPVCRPGSRRRCDNDIHHPDERPHQYAIVVLRAIHRHKRRVVGVEWEPKNAKVKKGGEQSVDIVVARTGNPSLVHR